MSTTRLTLWKDLMWAIASATMSMFSALKLSPRLHGKPSNA